MGQPAIRVVFERSAVECLGIGVIRGLEEGQDAEDCGQGDGAGGSEGAWRNALKRDRQYRRERDNNGDACQILEMIVDVRVAERVNVEKAQGREQDSHEQEQGGQRSTPLASHNG